MQRVEFNQVKQWVTNLIGLGKELYSSTNASELDDYSKTKRALHAKRIFGSTQAGLDRYYRVLASGLDISPEDSKTNVSNPDILFCEALDANFDETLKQFEYFCSKIYDACLDASEDKVTTLYRRKNLDEQFNKNNLSKYERIALDFILSSTYLKKVSILLRKLEPDNIQSIQTYCDTHLTPLLRESMILNNTFLNIAGLSKDEVVNFIFLPEDVFQEKKCLDRTDIEHFKEISAKLRVAGAKLYTGIFAALMGLEKDNPAN